MKRYSTTSIRAYAPAEDPNGEWVRYEEVEKLLSDASLGRMVKETVIGWTEQQIGISEDV